MAKEAEEKAAAQTANADPSQEDVQLDLSKMEEETVETAEVKQPEKEAEARQEEESPVPIEDITKREDGLLEWVVDPDDPKSTRYTGKDMKELFANIAKGTKEKDTFIHKLRSEQLSADSHKGKARKPDEDAGDEEYPNYGEIVLKTAKERGVDPGMLSWSDEQWAAYADEKGLRDFAVTRKMAQVKEVQDIASARYNEGNVIAINDATLDSETEKVQELVAEFGVSEEFTPDIYREVLTKVLGDEKNFKKSGIRKEGAVVAAAAKEIARIYAARSVKENKTKTAEALASGKSAKSLLTSEGPSRKTFSGPKAKPPLSFDEATEELLNELKAGKHKTAFSL